MKKYIFLTIIAICTLSACNDWLDREPYTILGNDVVWGDEEGAEGVLANLYDRLPIDAFNRGGYHGEFSNAAFNMLISDEAMWSGDRNGLNGVQFIDPDYYSYWDYTYIRDLNLFLEKAEVSNLSSKDQLIAEGRFLRAFTYFEMAKRYGGVPLITKSYEYDPGLPVEELQFPRATEEAIYDFIASELGDIVDPLPENKDFRRATKWSALALKSRAMLYAGSLARYNNRMADPIVLPGKEVGIDAGKAIGYYNASWDASRQIIEAGFDLVDDYFNVFDSKGSDEMILARDFLTSLYTHDFTIKNSTPSLAETENQGAEITPYLEMVEAYQYLDGTPGNIRIENVDGTPVYYDNIADAFIGKDLRFDATVLYGGTNFKNAEASILEGHKVWNGSSYETKTGLALGAQDEQGRLLRGFDGPSTDKNITNTGFYIKKFVSTEPDAGLQNIQATNYWPIFRYAEILLNAAEAGFELNKPEALQYINEVRERAGFGANSLSALTFEDIVHERKVELAYEGHRYFDIKRWRIAEEVLKGQQFHGLYAYMVIHPGDENHEKYMFEKVEPARLQQNKVFERRNYYTFIPSDAYSKNPKLVLNPGQ
ncbi:MAG: RagB/SusD family nutrient uptake outer membrane protein [Cytophagales bacterium]|nr:RagB/SusD family nutrient uptake outer membrane protein [Cytophagales bacterium]